MEARAPPILRTELMAKLLSSELSVASMVAILKTATELVTEPELLLATTL